MAEYDFIKMEKKLAKYLDEGVRVGLGSDISGGSSLARSKASPNKEYMPDRLPFA